MNEYINAPVGGTENVAVITDVKHYAIDDNGNRVEIPFDIDGGSETSPEETTVYIAADEADHIVTVH